MTAEAHQQRYTAVAIILHWLIAAGIIGMIALGWTMDDAPPGEEQFALIQLHKSIGITILLLTVARIAWRLMNPPPPEPPMPAWQRGLALLVHVGLYVLMLAMPITGWIMTSADLSGIPTVLYDTVPWPHVPGVAELPRETREGLHEPLEFVHGNLAWVAIGLLVLHVAGALKHHFIDRDGLIARMLPGLAGRASPPKRGRGAAVAFGAAVLLFAAAAGYAQLGGAPPASAEQQQATGGSGESSAPFWKVDPARSSIVFKSAYMGRPFEGRFQNWEATIQFDPAKPQDARIRVVVKTASAKTGEPYFDDTLPAGDWFDAGRFPDAVFRVSEGVFKDSETEYEATGVLNIKGVDYPLRLPFTLNIDGSTAKMHAEVPLSRLAITLGRDTRAEARGDEEWVQDEVRVVVDVVAERQ